MKEKYEMSHDFEDLSFTYIPAIHEGLLDKYIYNADEDNVKLIVILNVDSETGKPDTVFFRTYVGEEEQRVRYLDVRSSRKSGSECERDAVEFIKNNLDHINEIYGTSFNL